MVITHVVLQQAKYVLDQTKGHLRIDSASRREIDHGKSSGRIFRLCFSRQGSKPPPSDSMAQTNIDSTPFDASTAPALNRFYFDGAGADRGNLDPRTTDRETAGQNPVRIRKTKRLWPPSFDHAGGEYDLNPTTGWYCHNETAFMYDPVSELYLNTINRKWFRRQDSESEESVDNLFSEVDAISLSTEINSKMQLLGYTTSSDMGNNSSQLKAQEKQSAHAPVMFKRSDQVQQGSQIADKTADVVDLDDLMRAAKGESAEEVKTGDKSAAPDSQSAASGSASVAALSKTSQASFKASDTRMRQNSVLIKQWTQRQQDEGAHEGESHMSASDYERLACTYPVDPNLSYKGKPVTMLSKKDNSSWLCWICIRKFSDEKLLAKHVNLSDLHRDNVKAAAKRTVALSENGSDAPEKKADASQNECDAIFAIRLVSNSSSMMSSNDSNVKLASVDRAHERRKMHGQRKSRFDSSASGSGPSFDNRYRTHTRGGRGDVSTFPSFHASSSSMKIAGARVVRASTKVPIDTRSSFGAKLMRTMGWKPGEALGISGNGIVAPVDAVEGMGGRLGRRAERLGLGHPNADSRTDTSTLSGILALKRKKRRGRR